MNKTLNTKAIITGGAIGFLTSLLGESTVPYLMMFSYCGWAATPFCTALFISLFVIPFVFFAIGGYITALMARDREILHSFIMGMIPLAFMILIFFLWEIRLPNQYLYWGSALLSTLGAVCGGYFGRMINHKYNKYRIQ